MANILEILVNLSSVGDQLSNHLEYLRESYSKRMSINDQISYHKARKISELENIELQKVFKSFKEARKNVRSQSVTNFN